MQQEAKKRELSLQKKNSIGAVHEEKPKPILIDTSGNKQKNVTFKEARPNNMLMPTTNSDDEEDGPA